MNTKRYFQTTLITLFSLLYYCQVLADSGEIPDDQDAGDDQDTIISKGVNWLLPEYGATWIDLNDPDVDATLDWSNLVVTEKISRDDQYVFVGIDAATYILDEEVNDEYHLGQGNGQGFAFGLGLLNDLAECNTVWLEWGEIIASTEKVSPQHLVVVGLDINDNGVSLSWSAEIQPTILYCEKWGKITQVQSYVNDENLEDIHEMECEVKPNGIVHCKDTGKCPDGYSKSNTQLWGCIVDEKEYRESIASIIPEAVLTAGSHDWIFGDLALIFPGAYLRHPVLSFESEIYCTWNENICSRVYSKYSTPVADLGWYDLVSRGITIGTLISPPRTFKFTAGDFGVYSIDVTSTQ